MNLSKLSIRTEQKQLLINEQSSFVFIRKLTTFATEISSIFAKTAMALLADETRHEQGPSWFNSQHVQLFDHAATISRHIGGHWSHSSLFEAPLVHLLVG